LLICVLPAIKFNYQSGFVANEIHNVQTQRLLAFEFEASEAVSSYFAPQNALRIRRLLTEALRDRGERTTPLSPALSREGRGGSGALFGVFHCSLFSNSPSPPAGYPGEARSTLLEGRGEGLLIFASIFG